MKNARMLTVALCGAALCLMSRPGCAALALENSHAPDLDRLALADVTLLSVSEMENMRGGFIDPTGLIFNFAVNVHTALNGVDVFTRSLNVSPSGPSGQLQATTTTNLLPNNIPGGHNLGVIGNGSGIAVTNQSGAVTTVLSQTAAGAPASIILNTGSNLNVAQSVSATLTLQNIASITKFINSATSQAGIMAQHTVMHSLGF